MSQVIGSVKVRVMPDTTRFAASAKVKLERIEKRLPTIKVHLEIDDNGLGTKARAIVEKAEKTAGKINVKVDVDDKQATRAITGTIAKLSGIRLGMGIFQHFRDFYSNIDRSVPLIGGLTVAALGLSGAMLAAIGNTFALSRALAQIGPGAVALPGLFAGIAFGLGATVAVFKDFNKELPTVQSRLSAIQDSMSEKFWSRARKPISEMVDVLLPKFARGLDGTARALGTFFGNLAGSFTKEFSGGAIAGMFRDLNSSIREMSKHTDSIARLFRVIGEAGAGRLPQLARWVGKLTDSFAKFMTRAEKTGKIDRWIDTSIERIKDLGRATANLVKLFSGLAKAADNAAPGDALDSLADALDRAQKVVNGPTFQRKLTGVLKAAHDMMERISTKAGPAFTTYWSRMADTLAVILPEVGDIIGLLADDLFRFLGDPAVQNGLRSLVAGIERGVRKLSPVIDTLADKSGAMMELIGEMADTFAGTFAASVQVLTPLLTSFLRLVTAIVDIIGEIPTPILQIAVGVGAAAIAFGKVNAAMKFLTGLLPAATAALSRYTGGVIAAEAATGAAAAGIGRLSRLMKGGIVLAIGVGIADQMVPDENKARQEFERVGKSAVEGLRMVLRQGVSAITFGKVDFGVEEAAQSMKDAWNGIDFAGLQAKWDKQKAAVEDFKFSIEGLKGTLDQLGNTTGDTRIAALEMLEQKLPGVTTAMEQQGISQRTLAAAAAGNAKAQSVLAEMFRGTSFEAKNSAFGQFAVSSALGQTALATREAVRATKDQILVGQDLTSLLGKIPKNTYARINAEGIEPTIKGVARVAKQYDLVDNRQVKALLSAVGIEPTVKNVQRVINKLKETGQVKVDLPNLPKGVKDSADKAATEGERGGKGIIDRINRPLEKVAPNLDPFSNKLQQSLIGIRKPAGLQGSGIGLQVDNGVVSGLNSGSGYVSAAARSVIRAALANMRAEADIHSPSRKAAVIGDQIGQGLLKGLAKSKKPVAKGAADMIRALMGEMTGERAKGVEKALDHIGDKLPKKASKAFKKHVNQLRGDMSGWVSAWQENADQLKQTMEDIAKSAADFSRSVSEAVANLGNPTNIELEEGQKLTFEMISKNMDDAIVRAKKWSAALDELQRLGLNATMFQQILEAGPEAGLASAEAIAEAGQAGVDAVNAQQRELNKYAEKAGKVAYDQHYANGVAMAQGLINGLLDNQRYIENAMAQVAQAMVKTIKKELKIKSPSRVMRSIGGFTGEGFVLGVEDHRDAAEKALTGLAAVSPRSLSVDRYLAPAAALAATESAPASVHIDSITIPLEDLAQLRTLEEFLEMLRVRSRQGASAA